MKENLNRNFIINMLRSQGDLKISEIAKKANVSRPSVYAHIDNLKNEGLVKTYKDSEAKGAPVYVKAQEKNLKKRDKEQIITFLKWLKSNDGIEMSSLEIKEFVNNQFYLKAGMRNFIENRLYLTKEGKKFLEENEG